MSIELNIDGMVLQGEDFTDDEMARFKSQFEDQFLSDYNPLRSMYANNAKQFEFAAQVAKAKLGNIMFGGGRADSTELTMDFIRPGHVMRTVATTETAANLWDFTYTANEDTFFAWNTAWASTPKIDQDALVVIIGWANESVDNNIDAIQLTIGNNDRPYHSFDIVNLVDSDSSYVLPTPIEILMPKVSYSGKAFVKNAGVQKLRPIGITFSTGEYARTAVYGEINK